ncbi:hypothetical protein [Bartonella apihabitans]
MYAMKRNNKLFVIVTSELAKSTNASGNRFAWENIKPYQKV